MNKITEEDWVVTKDIREKVVAGLGNHEDCFVSSSMGITTPVKAIKHPYHKGWFGLRAWSGWDYNYHPDWLIKVNQDGSPIEWSWLTELGW